MSQDKGGAEAINMTRAPLARPFSPDPLSGEEASRRRILSETNYLQDAVWAQYRGRGHRRCGVGRHARGPPPQPEDVS